MPAFPESASAENSGARREPDPGSAPDAVLIAGVNWLGDSIMSLPAIQAYRQAHPRTRLAMLVKPRLAGLWTMYPGIDEIWTVADNLRGLPGIIRRAVAARFRAAYILPHSLRSALVPFLAHIPERVGMPGHSRDWMLTRIVEPPSGPDRQHQSHEYLALFGVADHPADAPRLSPPEPLRAAALRRLNTAPTPRVAILPGAARGPAKRWPPEHYIALGGMLKTKLHCAIVVLGSDSERELCAQVSGGIGPGTLNLAGQTSLPEFAAILAQCNLAVANDSGGMHLAAAVGAPVLAIFGITDPQKTRPLGPRAMVLQESARRSRDIASHSAEAEASLRRIEPEQALEAAREMIDLKT
jgi:heptosyltransferase-2